MNRSLLIIDDDVTFCDALARAMRRRKFTVYTANSAQQGIEIADEHKPSHAIIDLRIGDESGLHVVNTLAQKISDIQMVVLTGFASITTAVEAIKLGAVQYLTKPADADEILAAITRQEGNVDTAIPEKPMSVRRLEWEHIQNVLTQNDGNISATARALGIHRRSLQRKLQKKPARI